MLWGTRYGTSAAARPSVNAFGVPGDNYWEDNSVCFPSAWPEKYGLPIIVRDLDAFPRKGRFKLAALDDVVASFWKFVEHCVQQLGSVKTQLEASAPPSEEQRQVLQRRAASLKEQLARAELLQRNVPFTIYWAADDQSEDHLKLRLRENLSILLEDYCGLTLWQRISFAGAKADAVRSAGAHFSKYVAKMLRCESTTVCEFVRIWKNMGKVHEIERAFLTSQALWGRNDVFDKRTKLFILATAGLAVADLVWVLESFIATRLYTGKAVFPIQELQNKAGPISVYALRRRAVCGFIEKYIAKGIEACDAAERRTPCDAAERRTALRKFQGPFQSVRMYWENKALHETEGAGNEWRQALPVWCSSKLHKLLREIMEGERDSLFAQACSHTVGGGIAALTFSGDLVCMDEWKGEVAALDAEFQKWHDDLSCVGRGGIGVNMDARHPQVHGGQTPCAGDPGTKSRDEVNPEVVELKPQIASIARNMREAHVGFAVRPAIFTDCVASVTSSEMFHNTAGGRVVYVYALDCAYDCKRPEPKPGRFTLKQQCSEIVCAKLVWREHQT